MKYVLITVFVISLCTGFVFAQDAASTTEMVANVTAEPAAVETSSDMPVNTTIEPTVKTPDPVTVNLTGTIVDNMCATANKENLAEFVKTHTKECVLKPECQASGYVLSSEGMLYPIATDSIPMVVMFLKDADTTLNVKVEGVIVDGMLKITSIKN